MHACLVMAALYNGFGLAIQNRIIFRTRAKNVCLTYENMWNCFSMFIPSSRHKLLFVPLNGQFYLFMSKPIQFPLLKIVSFFNMLDSLFIFLNQIRNLFLWDIVPDNQVQSGQAILYAYMAFGIYVVTSSITLNCDCL